MIARALGHNLKSLKKMSHRRRNDSWNLVVMNKNPLHFTPFSSLSCSFSKRCRKAVGGQKIILILGDRIRQ